MGQKTIRLTERELINTISKIVKESNINVSYDERAELVDDVISRITEFGNEYADKLKELNSQFEPKKSRRLDFRGRDLGLKM